MRINDWRHTQIRRRGRHQIKDLALLGFRWIADVQFQHEAIELRFGQLVGALLLERVLRGEDKKWVGEGISGFANRDLAFLHRLEERALDLGRGAIDFVG